MSWTSFEGRCVFLSVSNLRKSYLNRCKKRVFHAVLAKTWRWSLHSFSTQGIIFIYNAPKYPHISCHLLRYEASMSTSVKITLIPYNQVDFVSTLQIKLMHPYSWWNGLSYTEGGGSILLWNVSNMFHRIKKIRTLKQLSIL